MDNNSFNAHYIGSKFVWFLGICEDNKDPNNSNRIKVRIVGHHPEKGCDVVTTDDLPWAQVIMPPNSFHGNNSGSTVNILNGTFVIGFFLDEDQEYPIVWGVIPQKDYKVDELSDNKEEKISKSQEYNCDQSFRRLYDPSQPGMILTDTIEKETKPQPATNNATGTNTKKDSNNTEIDNTNVTDIQTAETMDTEVTLANGRRSYSLCGNQDKNLSHASKTMGEFIKTAQKLEIVKLENFQFSANTGNIGNTNQIDNASGFVFVDRSDINSVDFKINIDTLGPYAYLADSQARVGTVNRPEPLQNIIAFDKLTGKVQDINQLISDYSSMLTSSLTGFIDNLKAQIMDQIKKIFENLIPATVRKQEFSTEKQIEIQDILLKLIQCMIDGLFNNLLGLIEGLLQNLIGGCLEDILTGMNELLGGIIEQLMGLIQGAMGGIQSIINGIGSLVGGIGETLGNFDCNSIMDQLIDFLCELLGGNTNNQQGDTINLRQGTVYKGTN